jgi:ribosomal protein S18 acetylase RimI-like enzyme
MIKAAYSDKDLVLDILAGAFDTNQSVNYLVRQDEKRGRRIRYLMDYSFELCFLFGDVFLSPDKKACALVLYPEKKKSTFKSVLLDLKLIYFSVGLNNIRKALSREALIRKIKPREKMTYLWFIGVAPSDQRAGMGTRLLQDILYRSQLKSKPVYLETSTARNLPWYKKMGFHVYEEHELSYEMYFLRSR